MFSFTFGEHAAEACHASEWIARIHNQPQHPFCLCVLSQLAAVDASRSAWQMVMVDATQLGPSASVRCRWDHWLHMAGCH